MRCRGPAFGREFGTVAAPRHQPRIIGLRRPAAGSRRAPIPQQKFRSPIVTRRWRAEHRLARSGGRDQWCTAGAGGCLTGPDRRSRQALCQRTTSAGDGEPSLTAHALHAGRESARRPLVKPRAATIRTATIPHHEFAAHLPPLACPPRTKEPGQPSHDHVLLLLGQHSTVHERVMANCRRRFTPPSCKSLHVLIVREPEAFPRSAGAQKQSALGSSDPRALLTICRWLSRGFRCPCPSGTRRARPIRTSRGRCRSRRRTRL